MLIQREAIKISIMAGYKHFALYQISNLLNGLTLSARHRRFANPCH